MDEQWDPAGRDLFGVKLALEEALINGFKHGNNRRGKGKGKCVFVSYIIHERYCAFRIRDQGAGFYPAAAPDPTAPENIEKPGGRGLFLLRKYMTRVLHNSAGNEVTMVKLRSPSAAVSQGVQKTRLMILPMVQEVPQAHD